MEGPRGGWRGAWRRSLSGRGGSDSLSDVQCLAALDRVIHSQRGIAGPQSWPAGGLLVWRGLPCRVRAPFKERGGLTAETWWLRVRRRGLSDRWQMPDSRQRGRSEDTGILCTAGSSERSQRPYLDVGVGREPRTSWTLLGGTKAGRRASVGGVEMGAAERLGDSRGLGISTGTRETPREESPAPLGYAHASGQVEERKLP